MASDAKDTPSGAWGIGPVNVLFTFETVSAALDCELIFRALETPCRIIPVPRALSSSCAYALITETGDPAGLRALLRQRGAGYVKVFRCEAAPGKGETYEALPGE
jgi:hypothetical protein